VACRGDNSSAETGKNGRKHGGIVLGVRLFDAHRNARGLLAQRNVREEDQMTKYLTGVLTAIAAGVLLVAYALLGPRATTSVRSLP